MNENFNAELLKLCSESVCGGLLSVLREHNAADIEPCSPVSINKSQNIYIVCNAQVAPHLVALDIARIYDDNYLNIIGDTFKHLKLAVGGKTREHP